MRIVGFGGGLGDHLALTALVREVKRQVPNEAIIVHEPARPELWIGNPHINLGVGRQRWGDVHLSLNEDRYLGAMPHSFARQVGLQIVDDTPEIFLTEAERDWVPALPARTIALDPWAFWQSRRWPYERFLGLVSRLRADGWYTVELGKRDRKKSEGRVENPLGTDGSYFNLLGVRSTAALLEKCALFVGNDSGMMHLAAAVGTPQVAIFGAIRWYARAYFNTTPVFPYSECGQACFIDCFRKVEGKKHHCMTEIGVDRVFEAVRVAAGRWRAAHRVPAQLAVEACS